MPIITNTPDVFTAFFYGLLSFLSPCLLPLIPVYILYLQDGISGSKGGEQLDEKTKFRAGLFRALGFILGFTIVFMLLGFGASLVGQFLIKNKEIISKIAAVFIIFFGLTMLGVVRLNFLSKDYRRLNSASAIGMGMAFAFGWSPCIGPTLGAILATTAARSTNVAEGMFLLFVYSMGLAIPFLLAFIFIKAFEKHLPWISNNAVLLSKIGGALMVVLGLLILFGLMGPVTAFFTGFFV